MGKSTISMAIFNGYSDITRGYCLVKCGICLVKQPKKACACASLWLAAWHESFSVGENHGFFHGIWGFPKMGLPLHGWFMIENPMKVDDLGLPPGFPHISWIEKKYAVCPPSQSCIHWISEATCQAPIFCAVDANLGSGSLQDVPISPCLHSDF